MSSSPVSLSSIDLSDPAFWAQTADDREQSFAVLRREAPVRWFGAQPSELLPPEAGEGTGYWAVLRHADVVAVSRDPETFCSGEGIAFEDLPPELLRLFNSFLVMDDPEHKRLRGLVRMAFHPKQIRRIEAQIRARAQQVVADMLEHGDGDFVKIVSARLPMMTIWDMWGVPEDERAPLVNAVDKLVGYADPAVTEGRPAAEVMFENAMYLRDFGGEYAERRRAEPTEDLMSDLIRAEVDSAHLTTEEIQGFFVLLAIAGLDTTRHTTSHAMKALTDYPEQRDTLRGDLNGSLEAGVEEFVRWATPVMTFRRTATRDTHLGGQSIAAGDKVVLFYPSANRDEDAFDAPMEFNVSRTPNKHVGFGGGGPHFCLGNQLARTQLRALFSEILTRAPGLQAGDPEYLTSSFIHGVRRMPYQLNV